MSESPGTPPHIKTALLSRHWRLAVLAAAGLATIIGTTTTAGAIEIEHRKFEGAPGTPAAPADHTDKGGKADHGKSDKGDSDRHRGGKNDDEHGDKHGHHGDADAIKVECDPNELIAALVDLNADTGGTLVLAKDCTYTLTANEDENGLPEIT
ncbi:hypothetical protein ABZ532_29670, partial [Streptomyces sp. NPDC019396]|uniref:hypothetical protein n=1 Tax=Streptomyces sp. NPDC019396 TaxID=3154687 RepID=UPI0033FA0949